MNIVDGWHINNLQPIILKCKKRPIYGGTLQIMHTSILLHLQLQKKLHQREYQRKSILNSEKYCLRLWTGL